MSRAKTTTAATAPKDGSGAKMDKVAENAYFSAGGGSRANPPLFRPTTTRGPRRSSSRSHRPARLAGRGRSGRSKSSCARCSALRRLWAFRPTSERERERSHTRWRPAAAAVFSLPLKAELHFTVIGGGGNKGRKKAGNLCYLALSISFQCISETSSGGRARFCLW